MNTSNLESKTKQIRYADIIESKRGYRTDRKSSTSISDSIVVDEKLRLPSYLFWNTQEQSVEKRRLVKWRLGRVVFHQTCLNCHSFSLSRKHAVECSRVEENLLDKYEILDHSNLTIIFTLLNKFLIGNYSELWKDLDWAICEIERLCLHH